MSGPSVDYMFFRNNTPNESKLSQQLERSPSHCAYCCQCSWTHTAEERTLSQGVSGDPQWICAGHWSSSLIHMTLCDSIRSGLWHCPRVIDLWYYSVDTVSGRHCDTSHSWAECCIVMQCDAIWWEYSTGRWSAVSAATCSAVRKVDHNTVQLNTARNDAYRAKVSLHRTVECSYPLHWYRTSRITYHALHITYHILHITYHAVHAPEQQRALQRSSRRAVRVWQESIQPPSLPSSIPMSRGKVISDKDLIT